MKKTQSLIQIRPFPVLFLIFTILSSPLSLSSADSNEGTPSASPSPSQKTSDLRRPAASTGYPPLVFANAVRSKDDCIGLITGNCHSKDCEAFIARNPELCETKDCKAFLSGNADQCISNDCKAQILGAPNKCDTDDCKAFVSGLIHLCSTDNCKALVSGRSETCK